MADFSALKTSIQNYIKQNGNEEITGKLLQQILLSMVSTLGDSAINDLVSALNAEIANRGNADTELGGNITTLQGVVNGIKANVENGYVYAGIATPSTTPVSGKVFYLALTAGTYTNFGSIVVPQGINILKYNGSAWSLDSFLGLDDAPTQGSSNLVKSGGVLDSIIKDGSAFDLSAYNSGATYADLSAALTALNALPAVYKKGGMSVKYVQTSDNKYVQFRLMSDTFSTTVTDWQGVDDEPTAGSDNLVKSGSVSTLEQFLGNYFGAYSYLMHGYALVDYVPTYQPNNLNNWSLIRYDRVVQGEKVSLYNASITGVTLIGDDGSVTELNNQKTWDGTYWNIESPSNGTIYVSLYAPDSSYTKEYLLNLFGNYGIKRSRGAASKEELNLALDNIIINETGLENKKGISQKLFTDAIINSVKSIDFYAQYGKFINPDTHEIGSANFTMLCVIPVLAGETVYIPWLSGGIEFDHCMLNGKDNTWQSVSFENLDNTYISYYISKTGYFYLDLRSSTDYWWQDKDMVNSFIVKSSQSISAKDAKAISMLLGGAAGKHLATKTIWSGIRYGGILKRNAQKDPGHDNDFFFTEMIGRTGDLAQQKPLVIECDLMDIHSFYATIFLFDDKNNFIDSFNLSGVHTLLLDPYYKVKICSTNGTEIYVGEPNDLGNYSNSSGSIAWIGTSIPAGAGYPEDVQVSCGYRVYNRAIGGSPLVGANNKTALALSYQEKIELGIAETGDIVAEESSYETRLMPYIDGTTQKVDALVFDHGYNDSYILYEWFKRKCIEKGLINQESDFVNPDGTYKENLVDMIDDSWIDWQPLKTTWTAQEKNNDFFSSFLFLRYTLLSSNPYLKVIMVSHLENKSCRLDSTASWSGMLGKLVCKCQQVIAEHFSYPFLNIAELTGWSKWTAMPGSTRQIVDDYNQATGQSALVYWINTNGEISTFQYFCPDGVHPQSDLSGHTRKYLSQLFIREFNCLI